MEITEGTRTSLQISIEEKQVLEENERMASIGGEGQAELSPVDLQGGVYPRSYFDVKKYPSHWKLVGTLCNFTDDHFQADDPEEAEDSWIGLTGENFKVRGPNYLKDKKKIMSGECIFKCLCCELVNSKTKMNNFSARPASLVQKLRAQGYKGFIYVYNIMVGDTSCAPMDR